MSSRVLNKRYYCSKCDKYLAYNKVYAEDKRVASVYCKKCGTAVKFIMNPIGEDRRGSFLSKLSKMVAVW